MWKQRLIRVSLLLGAGAIVIVGAKKIVGSPDRKSVSLPSLPIEQTLENFGENVLGSIAGNLPSVLGIKKKVPTQGESTSSGTQEMEPINQPVENVQNQTQQLLESIKKLPADQLEAIKKQLLKEFCEQLKGE